jgi:hypothetical protein
VVVHLKAKRIDTETLANSQCSFLKRWMEDIDDCSTWSAKVAFAEQYPCFLMDLTYFVKTLGFLVSDTLQGLPSERCLGKSRKTYIMAMIAF